MNILPLESLSDNTFFTGSGPVDTEPLAIQILKDILLENGRAQIIHGKPSASPLRSACIVGEEAGEVMRAALMVTAINPQERKGGSIEFWLEEMRRELVETASSAIRRIQLIDSGEMAQWLNAHPTQS